MTKIDSVNYLLGCDPELFVFDLETQQYVGSYGLVPGTKEAPFALDGGTVQVDGFALEFGIAPAVDESDFVDKIQHVMSQIRAMVPDRYDFHATPVVTFSEEEFNKQLPENQALGCDPDFNAWTLEANPVPQPPVFSMRSGGGHVHVGWGSGFRPMSKTHFMHSAMLTRQLDATLGVASLGWDSNSERRKIYGRAGAFRPKPYGMEYRTPSNAWLQSEETMRKVFKLTIHAIEKLHEQTVSSFASDTADSIINEGKAWFAAVVDRRLEKTAVTSQGGYLGF